MIFKTACPSCESEGTLVIDRGTFYVKDVVLEEDGFDLYTGRDLYTEEEVVKCTACSDEFSLDELMLDND